MSTDRAYHDSEDEDEHAPLHPHNEIVKKASTESSRSNSTTSLVLERLNPGTSNHRKDRRDEQYEEEYDLDDVENGLYTEKIDQPMERRVRRVVWIIGGALIGCWLLALAVYGAREYSRRGAPDHDPDAEKTTRAGKKITLDQVMGGEWNANHRGIAWIASPDKSKDGLLLSTGTNDGYLVVNDIVNKDNKTIVMESRAFRIDGKSYMAQKAVPSPNLKKVLLMTEVKSNFRHSFYAKYWIYDTETKQAEALYPNNKDAVCALAVWSPSSDKVAFVYNNNIYVRSFPGSDVKQVTKDGGSEYFHGVPDWVYEEEVLAGNSALWWSEDSKYFSFLRTNESLVPEYPVQYFIKRPSGEAPKPGLENYPEERLIKYPKSGAPNPVVDIQFYDVEKSEVFSVTVENDFVDDDRLVTEVLWAGSSNVLVRETNRESDVLKMVLVDVTKRTGKIAREVNITAIDGGWFEVTEQTTYIPADEKSGRPHAGYVDTVVHEGYDHLAYFTPLDNPEPILLTSGKWEVVDAPSAVDLKEGLVYFQSTEKSPIQRQYYSVALNGTGKRNITDVSKDGYYDLSFSSGAGYALVSYNGPGIPWQKIVGTDPNSKYEETIETNPRLSSLAKQYELPTLHYSTVTIDGYELNVVERRPPHFNKKKKYPVLFYVYGGPGSQQVNKEFKINFQTYVAAGLGYIVVTVDGRGTGYMGRKTRVCVRGNLGHYEAKDQIETAKIWAKKRYVDENRIAIWGWSYGGFTTLKTLEQDAGQTFHYGMAVAPVTDWSFYDSIYTERYMHTPQHNPEGFVDSAITNATALGQNIRFLLMHGVADDNVHFQNSLTLLDKLDEESVENYDVHVFPDSDHSIYFHNANKMVYDRLQSWLILAFNGEFLRMENEVPNGLR